MKLAIVTPSGNQIIVERSLKDLASEIATRHYPTRNNLLGPDRDKWKRDQMEQAVFDTLLRMSLEVARL